jgi:hypothetical protein
LQKLTVSCAKPPTELKIESGDKLRVQGTKYGQRVTARTIQNLTKSSPECRCEVGIGIMVLPEEVDLTGIAKSVKVSKEYVQFEFEA